MASSILPVVLVVLLVIAAAEAATFTVTNKCEYTVWAAAVPAGGGRRLDPGQAWNINVPAGTTAGRIWARTGCSFDGAGNGRCQTGDCGGKLQCTQYGQAPNTLAEFALNQFQNLDFFDISLIDGFNVPMIFVPAGSGAGCPKGGPRCPGKIRYAVRAECQVPGMFKPNIRFKQHITVHERMPKPPSQILLQDQQKVTACCCCTQGHVFVTAHIEKDQYFPGEMASAFLEIDNQSSVEFSAVALELHCHLTLRSDNGHLHEACTKVAYCSVPGVKPGEQQLKENARRVSLQLPAQLLSSANGQLVQCNYALAIRLEAPMHVSDPTVKLPITIYQAVPQYHEFAAPPPYWTPVVMGTPVQLSLPCAPPVPPLGQVMGLPADDTQPLLQPGMPGHSQMQVGAKSGWLAGQV